jgi:hypothetical protein
MLSFLMFFVVGFFFVFWLFFFGRCCYRCASSRETRGPWATLLTWVTLANIEIISSYIKYAFYFHLPHLTQAVKGAINLTNLPLFYVKMLVKFSVSGFIVLKNKIFKWPHPYLTFLWLSPLWRGPGPLFEQIWILFTKG